MIFLLKIKNLCDTDIQEFQSFLYNNGFHWSVDHQEYKPVPKVMQMGKMVESDVDSIVINNITVSWCVSNEFSGYTEINFDNYEEILSKYMSDMTE